MTQVSHPKTFDKKHKTAEQKVLKILSRIENLNLHNSYVSRLEIPIKFELGRKYYVFLIICVIVAFISGDWYIYSYFSSESCLLVVPLKPLFRPPADCSMCAGVDAVVRVSNISAREFEEQYAYKAAPVIVTDATNGWRAMKEFNFNFFAELYRGGKLGKQFKNCEYFAYKSGLQSLHEVFTMDEKRSNLSGQPWYVGWSTCYDEETRILRSYYTRPYFLPRTAESDMMDWIFMGGPGQGAHMHVDSVGHTSWQAQVRGHKQWQLAPPPECLYSCRWFNFTVAPGDVLVVDADYWYHKTNIMPGDISIGIGAEYD